MRACDSDDGSMGLGGIWCEHRHGGGEWIALEHSGRSEGGRGGRATTTRGSEEGTTTVARYGGRGAKLWWGIKGGGLGTQHDTLGMAREAPERDIGMVAARPELWKTEAAVRRWVPGDGASNA